MLLHEVLNGVEVFFKIGTFKLYMRKNEHAAVDVDDAAYCDGGWKFKYRTSESEGKWRRSKWIEDMFEW